MEINQIVKEIMESNGKLNNLPPKEKGAMELYLQAKLEQPHIQYTIYKNFLRQLHKDEIRLALSKEDVEWNEGTVELLTAEYEYEIARRNEFDTTVDYIICKYLDKLEI